MPLSLHPLRERNTARKRQKQVLKNFGKSSEILWRFRKMTYLCTRFECNTRFEAIRKKVLKKFWKILKNSFKKIWWFENKHLSLHRFPLKNRGQNSGRGRKADPGEIKEIVLIVIYWTAFFEVFEQLKVFSTLAREWFQTIPLRLELKIYNKTFFYNGEFDPGSGWTLAAGLTHASRGAAGIELAQFAGDRRTGA